MNELLAGILIAVLRVLIPTAFEAATPKLIEGDPDVSRREKLRAVIRRTWSPEALESTNPRTQ